MDDRAKAIAGFAKAVNKKFGPRTVTSGYKVKSVPRLSTTLLSLDIALGGGIPAGRVTAFVGEESSSKTSTAIRTAGNAQKLCANCLRPVPGLVTKEEEDKETGEVISYAVGKCDCFAKGIFVPVQHAGEKNDKFAERLEAYKANSYSEYRVAFIDVEGTLGMPWARKLGVDTDRLIYSRPDSLEEALDIYESMALTGAIDLFILDSVASMAPDKEVEDSIDKANQGLAARRVNKFVRTYQAAVNKVFKERGQLVTSIWINQWREKIGVMFGDNRVLPAGKGQNFLYSVVVDMFQGATERDTEGGLDSSNEMKFGSSVKMKFRVKKNKVSSAGGTGSYEMITAGKKAGTVDESGLFLQLAERFELLKKEGSKWNVGMKSFTSKAQAIEHIDSDPAEYARMRNAILMRMEMSRG